QRAPLVEICLRAGFPERREADGGRGQGLLALVLEVRQREVLEGEIDQLVDGDLGLVEVDPGLVPGLLSRAILLLLAAPAEDCPGLGPAGAALTARALVALAGVLAAVRVEPEARELQAADRHLDDLLTVRGDHVFLTDDLRQIPPDRLAHPLLVAL